MSLPTPNTRKEQYLNAIATGNAGGLPTPITREEEYLDAIAKSGGGSGEGDMKKSVYDSDLDVANAGGIKAFVNSAVAGKVDKVEGKGLSTNDYDDTEKGKVADNTEAITANTSAIEAMTDVNGACNILPFPYAESSKTDYEIQWTVNSDGTVRATGTNDHGSWRAFTFVAVNTSMKKIFPCAGDYILKCIGAQSGTYNFDFNVMDGSTVVINENIPDGGKKYTITDEMLNYTCSLIISIKNNISSSIDVTFKPMIYDARLNPTGYVPYAMTNKELTDGLTWKYLMTIGDNNAHSIDIKFKELYAVGAFGGMSVILLSNEQGARSGFYNTSSNNGDIFIQYINGELTVNQYVINEVNRVNNGVRIYYR